MPVSRRCLRSILALGTLTLAVQAEDLHFKKNISVGGNSVSDSEVWVKRARERAMIR